MQVLVVDNDRVFLKLMEKLLAKAGHEVLTARDGLSALDIVKNISPDFIFIDYVMPNIDGGALCKILKKDRKLTNSFVVLLSAIAAEEWLECEGCQADAYIAKTPFQIMKKEILNVVYHPEWAREYCSSGKVIGIDAISPRAITKELLTSKKHYNSLLNKMSEGILELNAEYRIVYANPSALSIFDKPDYDILGLFLVDLFPEEQRRQVEFLVRNGPERYAGNEEDRVISFKNKFLALKSTVLEGSEGHCLFIIEDITDLKRIEISLRETNSFLNSLLDSAQDYSIVSTDLDRNIIFWNKGAEEMFEYSAEEVVGKKKIDILYPRGMDREILSQARKAIVDRRESVSFVTPELTKEGEELWVKIHLSPRIDRNGNVAGILGIGENITGMKKVEEEKEELYNQVLQSRKLESIRTLAGGVAHDFNNLLMGIQGHISIAMLKAEKGSDATENLRSIEDFVLKGANLTSKLLNLAKGAKLPVSPKNVNAILEEIIELFKKGGKNAKVHKHLSDKLWLVDVNKVQIEQAFSIIFENALEAIRDEGTLTVSTCNRQLEKQHVTPYKLAPGNYIEVSIRDSGIGMDRKTMEKIFDPFFTTKKRGTERGAGLGLATVYTTVKNHAGMIRVQSEVGQGTTFTIFLPASKNCKIREGIHCREDVRKDDENAAKAILLIDDEEMVLEVGALMIRELGYDVWIAKSGKEGCEIYREHSDKIFLVILDLIMPDMNGEEVFQELKKTAPHCNILLSSGYNKDGDAERILNLGCKGFIQKPFNLENLSEKIRSALGR